MWWGAADEAGGGPPGGEQEQPQSEEQPPQQPGVDPVDTPAPGERSDRPTAWGTGQQRVDVLRLDGDGGSEGLEEGDSGEDGNEEHIVDLNLEDVDSEVSI